jgi:hypothetical protein
VRSGRSPAALLEASVSGHSRPADHTRGPGWGQRHQTRRPRQLGRYSLATPRKMLTRRGGSVTRYGLRASRCGSTRASFGAGTLGIARFASTSRPASYSSQSSQGTRTSVTRRPSLKLDDPVEVELCNALRARPLSAAAGVALRVHRDSYTVTPPFSADPLRRTTSRALAGGNTIAIGGYPVSRQLR